MGIQNRDYMKRPSGEDDQRASTSDARLEAIFSGFLQRHPKLFLYAGLSFVVLVVAAIAVAKFTGKGQ
jgi:hypothetical protein